MDVILKYWNILKCLYGLHLVYSVREKKNIGVCFQRVNMLFFYTSICTYTLEQNVNDFFLSATAEVKKVAHNIGNFFNCYRPQTFGDNVEVCELKKKWQLIL